MDDSILHFFIPQSRDHSRPAAGVDNAEEGLHHVEVDDAVHPHRVREAEQEICEGSQQQPER